MPTTRHGGLYGTQRNGSFAGRTAVTTLQVCHETRKALESVVSGIATVTVCWPNRPAPTTGTFWRVLPIQWGKGSAFTMGDSSRLGILTGRFIVEVYRKQGDGLGGLNDHVDAIRDAFNRLAPSVPSGMSVQVYVPGGPTPVTYGGFTGVRVVVPFEVQETITD